MLNRYIPQTPGLPPRRQLRRSRPPPPPRPRYDVSGLQGDLLDQAWAEVEESRRRARAELEASVEARQAAERLQSYTQRMLEHSDLLRQEVTQAREKANEAMEEAFRAAGEARSHRDEMFERLEEARKVEQETREMHRMVSESLSQARALRDEAEHTRQDALRLLREVETVRQETISIMRSQRSAPPVEIPTSEEAKAPSPAATVPEPAVDPVAPPQPAAVEPPTTAAEAPRSHLDVPSLDNAEPLMTSEEIDRLSVELESLLSTFGSSPQPAPVESPAPQPSKAYSREESPDESLAPGERIPDMNELLQGLQSTEDSTAQDGPSHRIYTGQLTLLITPHPTADAVQEVWTSIEGLVGSGQVLSSRPTSDATALEMVLDLGTESISSQEVLAAFPGARMTDSNGDQLTVSLPRS